jgi:putative Holliday junction resolvase
MRMLGLDIGDKRIGVAVCDPEHILATPLTTIMNDDSDKAMNMILDIINENDIKQIVVGLPYSLDGSMGVQAEKTKIFVEGLSGKTDAAICFCDERLSTVATQRLLRDAGRKKEKIKDRRDAAAAAYILQGYIDNLKRE